MKFPILYKYTTKGQPQQWQIVVDGDSFYTIEGIVGGQLTESAPTVCEGKNIGRANETTPKEQALKEAAARHQKKLDKSYNPVLTTEKKFFEPMLAKIYLQNGKKPDTNNHVAIKWGEYRVFVQPKLDGLRCINHENSLASRNGKPYLACPHLYQNDAMLDGELYNHDLKDDFGKIVSLCKKQDPTKEEFAESEQIVQHWLYDFPAQQVFSKRFHALSLWHKGANQKYFKLVPTYEVKSEEELLKYHSEFLLSKFEGTIIRTDTAPYENKRSKSLLKHKEFMDDEFEILDCFEGVGERAGTVGSFVVQLPNNLTCKSNVKGTREYVAKLWRNRKSLIGKTATVQFFGYTPDGALRFPFVIKIDRESYE